MSNRFIFTKGVQGILVFLAARRRLSIRGEERVQSVGRFEQGDERAGKTGHTLSCPRCEKEGVLWSPPQLFSLSALEASGSSFCEALKRINAC
ncbi:hypothetical protein EMGBD2_13050 [Nitrospirota bacterium]|nr:hypothetical protein EMGBD2_13050 [Nitrospirota bacterium]